MAWFQYYTSVDVHQNAMCILHWCARVFTVYCTVGSFDDHTHHGIMNVRSKPGYISVAKWWYCMGRPLVLSVLSNFLKDLHLLGPVARHCWLRSQFLCWVLASTKTFYHKDLSQLKYFWVYDTRVMMLAWFLSKINKKAVLIESGTS